MKLCIAPGEVRSQLEASQSSSVASPIFGERFMATFRLPTEDDHATGARFMID
jgi:hypothetical protein